ncbi:MAG TPA: serine/threonine-protein kinase [Kofleriaceae bacterium]
MRFGEFEIVQPIAKGGMASVYEARRGTERVALKVLDPAFAGTPELVEQLFAELDIARRVRHPGVLKIHGAGRASDGAPFLVMELLRGETVADLAERGALGLDDIAAIGAGAAAALAAMHAAGVVHCDVKHDNLVLCGARVKVIDFGVARLVGTALDVDTISGTPWCMAPEQWRGRPVPASDVYALGCVLYELTTGNPPFDGSLPALMTAHFDQRPARPSWLRPMPMALERLIVRALAKAPADRPTMGELAVALSTLADATDLAQAA